MAAIVTGSSVPEPPNPLEPPDHSLLITLFIFVFYHLHFSCWPWVASLTPFHTIPALCFTPTFHTTSHCGLMMSPNTTSHPHPRPSSHTVSYNRITPPSQIAPRGRL
ncbi:hypothetical protein N665_0009s0076 [Sinapis alba]|nr:hypothetical protein N665_0009s0076 [Sinapis alba]